MKGKIELRKYWPKPLPGTSKLTDDPQRKPHIGSVVMIIGWFLHWESAGCDTKGQPLFHPVWLAKVKELPGHRIPADHLIKITIEDCQNDSTRQD